MKKLIFVCLGNICRSPMAEFIMKDLVKQAGRVDSFQISSAAASSEALGCCMEPRAAAVLKRHGVPFTDRRAVKLTSAMIADADLVIGMDEGNLLAMKRLARQEDLPKLKLLNEYSGIPHPVADPWYTGDFETAFYEIQQGCKNLLQF